MELADYLNLLRKRWLPIVALTLLGAFSALAISLLLTPTYTAQSQVFVSTRGGDNTGTGDLLQGANFTVRQVRSYTQLVASPRVLQPVINELGLEDTPLELSERVRAESPLDTVLINVSADDPSPIRAAEIANATATSLANVVRELEAPAAGGTSPVEISTVRQAAIPEDPSSPNTLLNLALGTLLGFAVGIVIAILREVLDTRIRDTNAVEQLTDAPVLGAIAYDAEATQSPLIVHGSPQSPRAESFRRLRTNLQFLEFAGKNRALVITSSLPTEGKSTTSVNLAITLAQAGQRVALVDADLRRPSVADYLGVEGSVGLTTVLIGRAQLDDVIQPWGNGNIDVITSGRIPPNPSELLGSPQMAELVAELNSRYDVVLIDTSPLLPVTDGAILARLVGGAILVVGANTVHKAQVTQALESLEAVGAPVLGIVVNRVVLTGTSTYGYSYYGYPSMDDTGKPVETETTKRKRFGRRAAKKAIAEYPGASESRSHRTTITAATPIVADPAARLSKPVSSPTPSTEIVTTTETVKVSPGLIFGGSDETAELAALSEEVGPYVNSNFTPLASSTVYEEDVVESEPQFAGVGAGGPSFDDITSGRAN